jgi:sporulation protein YlmC with PRC-barrel domain
MPPGTAPAMSDHDIDTVLGWRGRTVVDRDGQEIGKLGDIYLDGETERPAFAGVRTGLFGRKESIVPLADAAEVDDGVRVPYEKAAVEDAPRLDPDDEALTPEEEDALFRHYGTPGQREQAEVPAGPATESGAVAAQAGEPAAESGTDAPDRGAATRGDPPAPAGDTGGEDDAMTRSEEEVRFGRTVKPRERVRLRKVLVTDHVERTVPRRREEIRLETDPPEGDVERVEDVPEEEQRPSGSA